jgi:hypothetical protein
MKIKISVLAFFIFSITTHLISQIKCVPAITHVSCLGGTNGSIVIKNITGDNAPYNFMWQPTGTDIDSITNNEFGSYNLTINGSSGINTSFIYNIGYKIKWQNFGPDVFQNGDILKSTTKVTWLKTANSSNILSGSKNGWVEYVVTTNNENKLFGLLDSTSGSEWNDIDFAIMLSSRSTINICENGIQTALGTYAIGDVLRIEKDGEIIIYKKNDEIIYSVPMTNTMVNSSLTIRAAIYDAYCKLENLGCSFESVNAVALATQTVITCLEPVVTLTASTNVIGANYLWTPGGSTPTNSTTDVINSSTYSIKITEPNYGCSATATINVTQNCNEPYYFTLKKVLDAGYYNSFNNSIYFKFDEEYYEPSVSPALNYKIYDDLNSQIGSLPIKIEKIGDNRFTLSLTTLGLTIGKYYSIKIINKKNEIWYARFKY